MGRCRRCGFLPPSTSGEMRQIMLAGTDDSRVLTKHRGVVYGKDIMELIMNTCRVLNDGSADSEVGSLGGLPLWRALFECPGGLSAGPAD